MMINNKITSEKQKSTKMVANIMSMRQTKVHYIHTLPMFEHLEGVNDFATYHNTGSSYSPGIVVNTSQVARYPSHAISKKK